MANWSLPACCKAVGVAAALGLASAGTAMAVDLPPAPTLPAAGASDEFSGWYLRGDLGAGFATAPELHTAAGAVAPIALPVLSPYAIASFRNTTFSPTGMVGAGVGYVFSPWLRLDGTLEYRFGARLHSTYAIADPQPLAAGPFVFADRVGAGLSSLVALVNGYVDLGDWWGASPFVGAGIGVADNALSGVSDQGFASAGGAASPAGGLFSNGERTSFAWALMAGLDVDIAPNLKLELSYRYLNLGSIAFGGLHCVPGAQACLGGARVAASSRNALASNDVRIGLIYLVGEPQAAPAPVAAR
jgi:opacity protein-like surface antigen